MLLDSNFDVDVDETTADVDENETWFFIGDFGTLLSGKSTAMRTRPPGSEKLLPTAVLVFCTKTLLGHCRRTAPGKRQRPKRKTAPKRKKIDNPAPAMRGFAETTSHEDLLLPKYLKKIRCSSSDYKSLSGLYALVSQIVDIMFRMLLLSHTGIPRKMDLRGDNDP